MRRWSATGEVTETLDKPVQRVVAVAAAVLVAGGAGWLARPDDKQTATPKPLVSATESSTSSSATPTVTTTPTPTSSPRHTCAKVSRAFAPRRITVPGITRNTDVITPPREPSGVPGVAPLTSYGKSIFAWDRAQGIRPGDPKGNVLLNAHTFPDGSALGNRLLADLHSGDRIVVQGNKARLCYRVTERVEVLASKGLPRYYAKHGRPQLAIVVCSGRRTGPGQWEKRTVWFASPAV
jgi:hypothetical protein